MSGIFSTLRTNLNGMSIQMKRLQTIAQNITNAQRSVDEDGKVYKRKIVVADAEKTRSTFQDKMSLSLQRSNTKHITNNERLSSQNGLTVQPKNNYQVLEVDNVKMVYDPANPSADEFGYVREADINVVEEMVDLMSANRAYEANISVMDAAKKMAKNTLKI